MIEGRRNNEEVEETEAESAPLDIFRVLNEIFLGNTGAPTPCHMTHISSSTLMKPSPEPRGK